MLTPLFAADDEPERPPSPSVHTSAAEDDGEQVLFETKCKLFFRSSGDGQVKLAGCVLSTCAPDAHPGSCSNRAAGQLEVLAPCSFAARSTPAPAPPHV